MPNITHAGIPKDTSRPRALLELKKKDRLLRMVHQMGIEITTKRPTKSDLVDLLTTDQD